MESSISSSALIIDVAVTMSLLTNESIEFFNIEDVRQEETSEAGSKHDKIPALASFAVNCNLIALEKGYDPIYNARFMNQTIQRMLEDPLAEELLKGKFNDGDEIRVGKKGDNLTFYKSERSASNKTPVLSESEV